MHIIRFGRLIFALVLTAALPCAQAQSVGTAFTYQGELRASGAPANAAYDFQFKLFNSSNGSTQVGQTLTLAGVSVVNGLFSVPLDFGTGQFAGDAQWLEISVRPATGGAFETLVPRTAVTPTPYALGAAAALANSVTTTSITDGSVQSVDLAAGAVGTAQINAGQVQRRVAGSCPGVQAVQSIATDGTVTCAPAPTVGALDCVDAQTSGISLSPGQRSFGSAACPAGYTVVSGGVGFSSNPVGVDMNASFRDLNGWFTLATNGSTETLVVFHQARCCRVQ